MRSSKATLLRFPLIFGTFLIASAVAFKYRREIMGDLQAQGKELFKVDEKAAIMLEEYKKEHARLIELKYPTST